MDWTVQLLRLERTTTNPLSPQFSVPKYTVRPRLSLSSPSSYSLLVTAFYTNTSKQVLEVHEEATRIKESKKAAASPSTATSTSTDAAGLPTGGAASAAVTEKAQAVAADLKAKTG